jgi:hypothetical protein
MLRLPRDDFGQEALFSTNAVPILYLIRVTGQFSATVLRFQSLAEETRSAASPSCWGLWMAVWRVQRQ